MGGRQLQLFKIALAKPNDWHPYESIDRGAISRLLGEGLIELNRKTRCYRVNLGERPIDQLTDLKLILRYRETLAYINKEYNGELRTLAVKEMDVYGEYLQILDEMNRRKIAR